MRPEARARAIARTSAPLFAALGDETRLRLLGRLSADGPASIARLTAGSGVSRQAVSKHLRVLAGAGLARGTRHGRVSRWELDLRRLDEARRLLDRMSRNWDDALGRLKTFVERPES